MNIKSLSFIPVLLSLFFTVSFLAAGEATPEMRGRELLDRLLNHHAPVILDVRTPEEFKAGHIHGAINIPHTEISSRQGELKQFKEDEIVVHCERGGRAARAEEELRGYGFKNVRHLKGDMSAWRKNGYPVKKGPASEKEDSDGWEHEGHKERE